MDGKRIWCFMTHVPWWDKYEVVESSDRSAVGYIFAKCARCGGMWKLWPARFDPGKWLARGGE